MSLTMTEWRQLRSWLTARSPFPPLVGATTSRFPSSERALCRTDAKHVVHASLSEKKASRVSRRLVMEVFEFVNSGKAGIVEFGVT